jgi:hypothetical protein
MEPVTITVLTALVTGAIAAFKGAAGEGGKQAYTALKDLIIRRFAQVKPALEMVSSSPESETKRAVLAEELESTGASKDQEVVAAAQRLLDALGQAQTDPLAAALFDFEQLKVARNLKLKDIKSVGPVLRAKTVDIGGDMEIEQIHQHGRDGKKKL